MLMTMKELGNQFSLKYYQEIYFLNTENLTAITQKS